jgi:hypothetical protein
LKGAGRIELVGEWTIGVLPSKSAARKVWEIIADDISKVGWSWGCVAAIDSNGTFHLRSVAEIGMPYSESTGGAILSPFPLNRHRHHRTCRNPFDLGAPVRPMSI